MTLNYMNHDRTMSIRGVITQQDGQEVRVTESDVVMYSFYSGGFEGIPLGAVCASSFTLELDNTGRKYTPKMFDNATVKMQIGILLDGEFVYSDFGEWFVDSSSAPEQSVSATLYGYDALGSRFAAEYTDTKSAYPTTIGSLVLAICTAAGVRLNNTNFPNAAVQIKKMPEWPAGVTLRDVLSYCAVCAGGFAYIMPNGRLSILSFVDGRTIAIAPDKYIAFTQDGGSAFSFNAIEAMMEADADDYTRYAIDGDIVDNATNTIQLDYNPLFTDAVANSVVNELRGFTADAGSLEWIGDPEVRCGDFFEITMLNGRKARIMATSLSFAFRGGLSCEVRCELPSISTVNGATYSAAVSQFDSNGNIRVTRIPGLDKKVISATTGHFETLTSSDVTADKLTTALLNAINIRAENIDTGKIETDVLTAMVANIIQATVGKIVAGNITTDALYAALVEIITLRVKQITAETITTDELYAALADVILLRAQQINAGNITTDKLAAQYAEIITLLVRNIKAEDIEADRLGAALANFVTMHAGTGEFDFATIQNLVAKALSLQQGSMDTVYIKNLAVTQANILSATLGKLVIKGDDGKYYRVFVGADGTISTEEVGLSVDEVQNGETASGQQIVETSMNVGSLNATNLQANSAVINQILTTALSAEKITAADALIASATIPALYVTAVQAIGGSIDFSANESIRLMVAKKNATFFKNETPTEYVSGDTWIKPDDGTWWIARGMTGKNMPEITSDERFNLQARFGEDAEDYQLVIDEDGYLRVNYGSGEIDEDGYLHSYTKWESLKPSELHTSFIDIAQDKLNIGSGGNVNINAGGELNVNAGAAHFRTAEYSLSILDENGSEDTIMDFDAEGKVLRVSEIEARNMRPYIAGTTQVTSGEVGGLDGLKGMLERAQYEHIIYIQNAHDMSDEAVVIDCCDSLQVDITADTLTRVPPIVFRRVTGNFLLRNLAWIASGQTALRMDSGYYVFENCSAEAATGIRASRNARVVWLGTDEDMDTAGACDTAVLATEGADVRLFGLIPAGLLTESMAGTIKAVDTRVGGNATGETGKTITVDAEYGYFGTENGWNADMLYQGYTEGKGRIYGCMKLELPGDVRVITAATLTLTRDSSAGRGSAANVRIYGSSTKYGDRPTLGDLYAERDNAASPGASASFDVTAGAQALLNGDIKQLVLYTGESTTATGKVYSRQYARFTKAVLKITY